MAAVYGTSAWEVLVGTPEDDLIFTGGGVDVVDGGGGIDTLRYHFTKDYYSIQIHGDGGVSVIWRYGNDEAHAVNVERVQFSDSTFAVSMESLQVYRLYQAAFDRTPDMGGVAYWIDLADRGMSATDIARQFIGSDEFRGLYGADTTNEEFIDLLYANVLHRNPDQDGYTYWTAEMANGMGRDEILLHFSDSGENWAQTAAATASGVQIA